MKEIILIKDIVKYLETHLQEIDELCKGYDWEDREIGSVEDNDTQEKSVDYEGLYRNSCIEIVKK